MHEWTIFTDGIKTMPPGHRMQFFFDVGFQPFKGNSPLKCTFVVDCDGPFGPAPQATYLVDLTPYEGAWAAPTTLNSVVKQLEKVAGAISDLGAITKQSQANKQETLERSLIDATQIDAEWASWRTAEQ